MSNHTSHDVLPTRSTINTQAIVEFCALDADHRAREQHLHQRDLDRCLFFGLQNVHLKARELSHVEQALTILLQSGAKWNSDVLLDYQITPYHIICASPGDHHELLDLMIKSSQQIIIDTQDIYKCTALMYAVGNANINCVKCLITHGADVTIGAERDRSFISHESWGPIMQAIEMLGFFSKYSSVIMSNIFDLLFDSAVDRNKDHFKNNKDYIIYAVAAPNVNCIKKLIKIGAPLDIIAYDHKYVWQLIAGVGNIELLKCMFNRGIDKDTTDQNGLSVLWWVVSSGEVEAVRYLLDLGVAIPTYEPDVRETRCKWCNKTRLIIYDYSIQDHQDPCMNAIRDNNLDIVKLLDERGSQTCKSFPALRCAVKVWSGDLVSYLLNKYTYPLNIKYTMKGSLKQKRKNRMILTLLAEPFSMCRARITKLLLDHGADPAKVTCAAQSENAIIKTINYGCPEVIVQYIRSGIDVNFRTWNGPYLKVVSPFEASILFDCPYISVILLISGCSRGEFTTCKLEDKPEPKLEKLMKEWNVFDNNAPTLKQRCRSVILNHLCPRADMKIEKLPLPGLLIKFLSIPELDHIIDAYDSNTF